MSKGAFGLSCEKPNGCWIPAFEVLAKLKELEKKVEENKR